MSNLIDATSETTADAISTAGDVTADLIDAAGDATADLIDAAGGATTLAAGLATNGARFAFTRSRRTKGVLLLLAIVGIVAYRKWQSSKHDPADTGQPPTKTV